MVTNRKGVSSLGCLSSLLIFAAVLYVVCSSARLDAFRSISTDKTQARYAVTIPIGDPGPAGIPR